MKIFTRKNALIGYLVLNARKRAVKKRVRRSRRSGLKIAAYVGLGLISAGVLAAVFAVALKHRSVGGAEVEAGLASEDDSDSEIVGEYVTAPEPVPAT